MSRKGFERWGQTGEAKYKIRLRPCYYTLDYNVPEFEAAVMLLLGPKKNNTTEGLKTSVGICSHWQYRPGPHHR
jgi:hypothetical protein